MRIRTIKPEFWTHPVMIRLSDTTKLVALGLLNYADDEGFFYADPRMVRAALRPLDDDSAATDSALSELSINGYIEVRNHPTHGPIGRIASFRRHQVINRPNKSVIAALFSEAITEDSRNVHGVITEDSVKERKGSREGNKGKEQGKETPTEVVFPLALNTPAFIAAWSDWCAYRRERKLATLKPRSIDAQLAKLADWGHDAAIDSIRESIAQNWQGLFEPKASGGFGGKPRPAGTSAEMARKLGYQEGM